MANDSKKLMALGSVNLVAAVLAMQSLANTDVRIVARAAGEPNLATRGERWTPLTATRRRRQLAESKRVTITADYSHVDPEILLHNAMVDAKRAAKLAKKNGK